MTYKCSGPPHLSCKRDQIKMRDYVDRRVTSPTWGPPSPCKQAHFVVSVRTGFSGFHTRCACRAVVLLINPVVIDVFVVALKFKSSFNGMNANLIECYTHAKQA